VLAAAAAVVVVEDVGQDTEQTNSEGKPGSGVVERRVAASIAEVAVELGTDSRYKGSHSYTGRLEGSEA